MCKRIVPRLDVSKYFVQAEENSLYELFDMQHGFDSLEEAKAWIKDEDPKLEYAWNIYSVDVLNVWSN